MQSACKSSRLEPRLEFIRGSARAVPDHHRAGHLPRGRRPGEDRRIGGCSDYGANIRSMESLWLKGAQTQFLHAAAHSVRAAARRVDLADVPLRQRDTASSRTLRVRCLKLQRTVRSLAVVMTNVDPEDVLEGEPEIGAGRPR